MQDLTFELLIKSATPNGDPLWTDITDDVRQDDVGITYGRIDESATANPSSCSLRLDNSTDRYSPRNPMSVYYNRLGRNTPIRVSLGTSSAFGYYNPGDADGYVSTADSVPLSITGEIDIRVEVQPDQPDNWATGGFGLIAKYVSPSQRSWAFYVNATGNLSFAYSSTGSATTIFNSTVALPTTPTNDRRALAVVFTPNNGSGNKTVRFYTATALGQTFTQLGATVSQVGTTAIFNSTAPIQSTFFDVAIGSTMTGTVHRIQIRSGLNGTLVADATFSQPTAIDGAYVDPQGNSWSITSTTGGGWMASPGKARFNGEIASWSPRWNITETDRYVPIECSGPLRRLGQSTSPEGEPLRTYLNNRVFIDGYWPLEDGTTSTFGAPDVSPPNTEIRLTTTGAPSERFGRGTLAPWLNPVMVLKSGDQIDGQVWGFSGDRWFTSFIFAGADPSIEWIFYVGTTNNASWNIQVDFEFNEIIITPPFGGATSIMAPLNGVGLMSSGAPYQIYMAAVPNGGNTDFNFRITNLTTGAVDGVDISRSGVPGQVYFVQWNSTDTFTAPLSFGHITSGHGISVVPLPGATALSSRARGLIGEFANDRISRLCGENDVPIDVDTIIDAMPMGPQYPDALLTVLNETERTDGGLLSEARDRFGLRYRSRIEIQGQSPTVTLDYDGEQVAPPLEPVDDDQNTKNDVTVQRRDGGTSRAVRTDGPLAVSDPVAGGVGQYVVKITVNPENDSYLPHIAGWRLNRGTVDEARYPKISVNLNSPALSYSDRQTILMLDVGDILRVDDMTSVGVYETVDQLIVGYDETVGQYVHEITFNCVPASPLAVFILDSAAYGRLDSETTTSAVSITTTQTNFQYAVTDNTLWTGADQPFDIIVDGERMTVTSVATSPDRFFVTRSVNGVIKTHSIGAEVKLADPVYLAI